MAYRLDPKTVSGNVSTSRRWKADPWLEEAETLEPEDYDNAHAVLGTNRGHQAPLGHFKRTAAWHETNYLSNITSQKSALNQGPWQLLETEVREYDRAGYTVHIITGPYYELGDEEPEKMPSADEDHETPAGYWKIIVQENAGGRLEVIGFRIIGIISPL